jgi:hypothetical protein
MDKMTKPVKEQKQNMEKIKESLLNKAWDKAGDNRQEIEFLLKRL